MTRVLIVDDEALNRMLLGLLLRLLPEYNVAEAENGKVAIEMIESEIFDIILMDINMPVMNGYETTRYIRANISKDVPIIAVTANDIRDIEKDYADVGFSDYLQKPIVKDKLVEMIDLLVDKVREDKL